jgi:hypothetical protein
MQGKTDLTKEYYLIHLNLFQARIHPLIYEMVVIFSNREAIEAIFQFPGGSINKQNTGGTC